MREENQGSLYTRVINMDEGTGAALKRSLNNLVDNKTPSFLQLPEGIYLLPQAVSVRKQEKTR